MKTLAVAGSSFVCRFTIPYRYGFNGQEKTDEVSGSGNHIDFKYRGYDPRTGRFWSVDPMFKEFPFYSSYQFASNNPILAKDLEGLESSDNKNKSEKKTSTNKPKENTLDPKSLHQNLYGNYTGLDNPKNYNGTENLVTAPPIDEVDKLSQNHDLSDADFANRTSQGLKADLTFIAGQAKIVAKSFENGVVIPYMGAPGVTANPNKDAVTKQPYSGKTTSAAAVAGAVITVMTAVKIVAAVTVDPAVKTYDSTVSFVKDFTNGLVEGLTNIQNWGN